MGFLNSLFGDKIENENRTKPFHNNSNSLERKDWFARTRPWSRIHPRIIDALTNKFGDNPMFEVFVMTSMENSLVQRYEQLNGIERAEPVICSMIATMLCEVGTLSTRRMVELEGKFQDNIEEVKKYYRTATDTLENAIILDKNQINAYVHLSFVMRLLKKYEEGYKYARQGIAVIRELRKDMAAYQLSDIQEVKNAGQAMDEIEKSLKEFMADYEKHLV